MFAGSNLKITCDKCKDVRYFHKGEAIESIRCHKCGSMVTICNLDTELKLLKEDSDFLCNFKHKNLYC